MIPLSWFVGVAILLFGIGTFGVLRRRNAIMILMSIELMLNAVTLLMVAASAAYHDLSAQVAVFFMMIIAAAEVAVGLIIVTLLYKRRGSLIISDWGNLKG